MKTFVSAIVISHDSPEFLSKTLAALQNQGVNEVIRVETGNDTTSEFSLPNASLSKSLDFAVSKTSAASEWLWVLHDDSAPLPGALSQLLAVAEVSPSVAVIGPKQVDFNDHRIIVQQGLTLTSSGKLFSLVSNELDQSQYDAMSDVLAVGTAGMLVKKSVWLELGGLADKIPPLAADIDFSMRVRAKGHRVVVAPQARVAHATLTLRGKRDKSWLGATPKTAMRRAELQIRLSWAPLWQALLFWLALPVITAVRLIWRIWAKRPDRIAGELAAAFWAGFTILARLRARRSITRAVRRAFAALYASKQQVRDDRRRNLEQDEIDARLEAHAALAERDQLDSSAPNTEQLLLGAVSTAKTFVQARGLWFVGALLVLSYAFWPSGVALNGGATISLNQNWFDLFRRAGASWHAIGQGFIAPSDPFVWVLTLFGSLTFWAPSLSIAILFFVALPLAFFGAFKAASVFTTKAYLRNLTALAYALWPSLLQSQQDLRLPSLVALIALPYLVFAVSRVALLGREISVRSRQQTFTWVGLAGLLLAIISASAPNTMAVSLLALLVVFLLRPKRIGYLIWIPLPTFAIFAPLFVYLALLLGQPLALLADPALPLASNSVPFWQFVSGSLEQTPLGWISTATGLLLLLFAALALLSPRFKVVIGLLSVSTLALGLAWLVSLLQFVAPGVGPVSAEFVNGSPQALLGIWGLGLALSTAVWLDSVRLRQASRTLATLMIGLLLLPSAAVAALSGNTGSYTSGRVMPAIIDAQAKSGLTAQVLTVEAEYSGSGFTASLVEADGVQLEDLSLAYRFALASREASTSEYQQVSQLVADMVSANPENIAPVLQENSIGYVLIPRAQSQAQANANARLAVAFDSLAPLESAGETDFGQIWRVRELVANFERDESSPWSITKLVQLGVLLSFVLLAVPSAGRKRAAASSEIFVDSSDSND
jgi:GT2 family glycosyltransferase